MAARAILTVDLGFGDAGKGSVVDYLARRYEADLIVRFNGGCQAAHNVVTPEGLHHTFAQLGSATFVGVPTFLSRFMLVAPDNFLNELNHLQSYYKLTPSVIVDGKCPITTPFHRYANRLREIIRGGGRHGSCGEGIAETVVDVLQHHENMLYAEDLLHPGKMKAKLQFLQAAKALELNKQFDIYNRIKADSELEGAFRVFQDREIIEKIAERYSAFVQSVSIREGFLEETLNRNKTVIFEAAQGVLLDEEHGFFPYVTRSKTTLHNAETLLAEAGFSGEKFRLGITRAYGVRHGPGPFVTEDPQLTLHEHHNRYNNWQRTFRLGHFDAVSLRYAICATNGVDGIALTCLDIANDNVKVANSYRYDGPWFWMFWNGSKESGIYRDIACYKGDHFSLENQSNLTNALMNCSPMYVSGKPEDYVNEKIVGKSFGQTHKDKKFEDLF